MLNRLRIFVAEDEPLTAWELGRAVEDADGEVVGPVASVEDGLALLARQEVDAAILDVRLVDRDIAPIAAVLLEQGKVVVFHTASPIPDRIAARFGEVVTCPKPMQSEQVVLCLAALIGRRGGSGA